MKEKAIRDIRGILEWAGWKDLEQKGTQRINDALYPVFYVPADHVTGNTEDYLLYQCPNPPTDIVFLRDCVKKMNWCEAKHLVENVERSFDHLKHRQHHETLEYQVNYSTALLTIEPVVLFECIVEVIKI